MQPRKSEASKKNKKKSGREVWIGRGAAKTGGKNPGR